MRATSPNAFSIIELLVVIAIVAILSSTALPTYKEYRIKATAASAVIILQDMVDKGIEAIEREGSFPSTISYGGQTYTTLSGTAQKALDAPPIVRAGYWDDTRLTGIDDPDKFVACVYVTGLEGITGYVAPTASSDGARAAICAKAKVINNTYVVYCGSYSSGGFDVPVDYLPAGCNCSDLRTETCD